MEEPEERGETKTQICFGQQNSMETGFVGFGNVAESDGRVKVAVDIDGRSGCYRHRWMQGGLLSHFVFGYRYLQTLLHFVHRCLPPPSDPVTWPDPTNPVFMS